MHARRTVSGEAIMAPSPMRCENAASAEGGGGWSAAQEWGSNAWLTTASLGGKWDRWAVETASFEAVE